jgi:hypothetical protein
VALTATQQERVLQTIKERVGGDILCPLCSSVAWTFVDGVAVIPTQETLDLVVVPDRGLPSLPLVCRQCGNMQFLNVLALGLGDIFQADTCA